MGTPLRILAIEMDISNNNLPVHRSSTRRKACSCCVKAKRRCDLTLPACARCRTRGLQCIYVESNDKLRENHRQKQLSPKPLGENDFASSSSSSDDFSTSYSTPQMDWVNIDPMLEMSPNSLSAPYDSYPFPELGFMSNPQIDYCVSQLKNWVSSFVLENQTPFIHHLSYQDEKPLVYQDVLSICSLYMHQTPKNRSMVFQILDFKLASLIQQSSMWISPEDSLIGLQALILYQIIRIFDGDVRQRANAERNFVIMDAWTVQLHQNYFDAEQRSSHEPYKNWILLESIRRTIMVSVILRDLFTAMKDGVCELIPLMTNLPVSSMGKLWNTADQECWEGSSDSESLITYGEFVNSWNSGAFTDVEEYEKMLLVACRHANGTIGTSQFANL